MNTGLQERAKVSTRRMVEPFVASRALLACGNTVSVDIRAEALIALVAGCSLTAKDSLVLEAALKGEEVTAWHLDFVNILIIKSVSDSCFICHSATQIWK